MRKAIKRSKHQNGQDGRRNDTANNETQDVIEENGAGARNRTADLRITNALLYRLSYASSERRDDVYITTEQRIAT